ncbi:MAG: hypothetical protein ACFFAE_14295 [Candidatus Hodarchaeota archaeon]
MKSKSLQLLILVFLFLLISFGLHQYTFVNSLAEKRIFGAHEYNPINNIMWVQSGLSYIDPYPNWFIRDLSSDFQYGEKALGPPDNEFALIHRGYGNGYLTLDFGSKQEIINNTGPDFTIIAKGGNYIVRIMNNLSKPSEILQNDTGGVIFSGNNSFDLSETNHATVRYVRVESGSEASVELDAIEALYYNQPAPETTSPQIVTFTGPEDLWVWSDQSSVQLSWDADDSHPWNYSILVDDELVEEGFWDYDSLIKYKLSLTDKTDAVKVTLILDDLFGNRFEDTIEIEIRLRPTTEATEPTKSSSDQTSDTSGKTTIFPLLPFLIGVMCVTMLKIWKRKLDKKIE